MKDAPKTVDEFIDELTKPADDIPMLTYNDFLNTPKTFAALEFAKKAHRDQRRQSTGNPYIFHCLDVLEILRAYKTSKNLDELGAICMLHDVVEDTCITREELEAEFGKMIADTVWELTNDEQEIKKIGKEAYINAKLLKMSNYALIVKLADMLANIRDFPPDNLLNRILNHMTYLKKNRALTKNQQKLVRAIRVHLLKTLYKNELPGILNKWLGKTK